jgi:hypothetical protein
MPRVLLALVVLGITIYSVIDAIQTEDTRVQHLPKVVWILLILLSAPTGIGAIAWLVTGRQRGPQNGRPRVRLPDGTSWPR